MVPTYSRRLSARRSGLWAVCSARSRANLGSHLCHSETGAKATPQTSPLGGLRKARLRTRSAPRRNWHKDEMGTTTSADGVSLIKTQPKIPSPSYRNPAMGDTSFRVLPSPNPKQPQLRPRGMIERSGFASSSKRDPLDPLQCLVPCLTRDFDLPILEPCEMACGALATNPTPLTIPPLGVCREYGITILTLSFELH